MAFNPTQCIAGLISAQADMSIQEFLGTEIPLFLITCVAIVAFQSRSAKGEMAVKGVKSARGGAVKRLPDKDTAPRAQSLSIGQHTAASLRNSIQSMLDGGRAAEVPTVLRSAFAAQASLCTSELMIAVLDMLDEAGLDSSLLEDARATFTCIDVARMQPHTIGLQIKSALKNKRLDEVMESVAALQNTRHLVPGTCLAQVLRLGVELGETERVTNWLYGIDAEVCLITPENLASICEQVQVLRMPGDVLGLLHKLALKAEIALSTATYETMIRGFACLGETRAVCLLEEMDRTGLELPETSCLAILSACVESKQVRTAERVSEHLRCRRERLSLPVYTALLKVYSANRSFRKACDLHACMVHDGVVFDVVAYGYLIRSAAECGRLDLAQRLFKESENPDLLNCMSLIRAAGRERELSKALALLADLERSPVAVVDTTLYNCVLDVCVECKDHQAAKSLFSRMKSSGHVDVISYNTFLKSTLGCSKDCRAEVEQLLKDMRRCGFGPNAVTYNSLINAAVNRGDVRGAWTILDDMEGAGISLDACTCSIVVKGIKHCTQNEAIQQDIERLLRVITRAHVEPDEVLVSDLLEICAKLGARGGRLLTQVVAQIKDMGVAPSLRAYVMLFKAYGAARQLSQAWDLWQQLAAENIVLDEEIYVSMVEACAANGDMAGALRIFREMKQFIPTSPLKGNVFSMLIKACLKSSQSGLAMELFSEMQSDHTVWCSLVAYNTLIDAFARAGNMAAVGQLFQTMCSRGVQPDVITYSTAIKGYCVRGELEQAIRLLGLMRQRGIEADEVLFNSVLDGCAHQQMRGLMERVLEGMLKGGIAPSNFTLSILVKLYGRCHDLDKALEVVAQYPKQYGFRLNAQVYTCLMSACISNGRLGEALTLFREMQAAGCAADAKTYQTLLNGCFKHNDYESAVSLVGAAIDARQQRLIDGRAIDAVLLGTARSGKALKLGCPLLDRLQNAGVAVSSRAKGALQGSLRQSCSMISPPSECADQSRGLRPMGAVGVAF